MENADDRCVLYSEDYPIAHIVGWHTMSYAILAPSKMKFCMNSHAWLDTTCRES
jgi:hypothetical protein